MSTAASRPASKAASALGPIVMMDVSGCGKSSVGERLAGYLDYPFVERDSLHPATKSTRCGGHSCIESVSQKAAVALK
ncbi:hypothetical protein ILFOPFJJ_03412 [Ensifer psoraleae]|nr:hypothetical protein [Sinorhizobium psoraleae]